MRPGRVAVVFRGDPDARWGPRLEPIAQALSAVGLQVTPVAFSVGDDSSLRSRLTGVDGALVWADPLGDDGDRTGLDDALRAAEAAGVWVSARPDVIDRIGTKEVLVKTRDLGWGSDAHLYRSAQEFRSEFPARLAASGVRVLKAGRGNGGRTVWKVRLPGGPTAAALSPASEVLVQHARVRDGTTTTTSLGSLIRLVEDAHVFDGWARTGSLVDQEFIPGVTRGIIRCYLVAGDVVGFARQYPGGVRPDGPLDVVAGTQVSPETVMGLPSAKTMYPPDEPAFEGLRERVESDWLPAMADVLDLAPDDLPALWDVDLLIDEGVNEELRFVLCEINASSVIPFPPQAPGRVARYAAAMLTGA